MDKEMWESRIIDYLDGKGNSEDRTKLEQELSQDAAAKKLFEQLQEVIQAMDKVSVLEPSSQLKMLFEKALHQEIAAQKKTTKTVFLSPVVYRVAAGFLLVMAGLAIGYEINKNQERERELVELKQQVEENRRLMLAMMDNQQSASQRMVGVSVAYEMETADDQIVQILVKTLNEDTNSNVRLAALEALGKFSNEEVVRQSLIKSLTTQKDPVVQIALIQLLVKMKEKGVLNQLEKIIKEASTMKAVKDEAHKGILKLS